MDIKKIHHYINGELGTEELLEFEEALKVDKELRLEVQLHREMMDHLVRSEKLTQAKSVILDVHRSYDVKPSVRKINRWMVGALAIAASIALFFMVNTTTDPLSYDQVYDRYFSPPMASFATKGSQYDETLQRAELAFNHANYKEALSLFTQYNDQSIDQSNGQVSFYQALSRMGISDLDGALVILERLGTDHPIFAKDCRWYMALIFIKKGQLEKALPILESFDGGTYAKRAGAVIEEIE